MTGSSHSAKNYNHADLLYSILPSVYRERDKNQDLKRYLNGTGLLLDQIHKTLLQRYADIFADSDDAFELDSQTWLLPYIAALLDVRLLSPLQQGKREEIAKAIAWRKAKGTVSVVEQVAEAVGGMAVVVHEGWQRVATTTRISKPLLSLENYGYTGSADYQSAFNDFQTSHKPDLAPMWSRHPGLSAGTVDFRCQASAVAAQEGNPASVISHIAGKKYRWRQSGLHASQNCNRDHSVFPVDGKIPDWIPGYFDDASVRTIDFRNPGWRQGHFHPRRVLLFTATHPGFFESAPDERVFTQAEPFVETAALLEIVTVVKDGDKTTYRNKTLDGGIFQPIVIKQNIELGHEADGTGPANPKLWRFEGFVFKGTVQVDSGRLELDRCAVLCVEVHSIDLESPVLTMNNCLCERVQAARGFVQLQYCTVLTTTIAEKLNASDCVFNGKIRRHHDITSLPGKGCVRYSSILPEQESGELKLFNRTLTKAVFYNDDYGEFACGVLLMHPATDDTVYSGAEDGGELGAYHHLYLMARQRAMLTKLQDFLPTGMEAVVIQDESLYDLPGEIED